MAPLISYKIPIEFRIERVSSVQMAEVKFDFSKLSLTDINKLIEKMPQNLIPDEVVMLGELMDPDSMWTRRVPTTMVEAEGLACEMSSHWTVPLSSEVHQKIIGILSTKS